MKKCEVEQHGWWDPDQRICARPVVITDITRRPAADKAAEAAARQAISVPARR
jgi:hypothetical protein